MKQQHSYALKLVFVTQFCDDSHRKKKHWKLIVSKEYSQTPPIITYIGNPSLRNELVQTKLKPLEDIAPTK